MKIFFTITFLFCFYALAMSQTNMTPTASIRIFGEVEKEITLSIDELKQMKQQLLEDQLIYNHKGEVKDTPKPNVKLKAAFERYKMFKKSLLN